MRLLGVLGRFREGFEEYKIFEDLEKEGYLEDFGFREG